MVTENTLRNIKMQGVAYINEAKKSQTQHTERPSQIATQLYSKGTRIKNPACTTEHPVYRTTAGKSVK